MRDVPHNTSINAYRLALMEFQNHMYYRHSKRIKKNLKLIFMIKICCPCANRSYLNILLMQVLVILTFLSLTRSIKYFPLKYILVILGLKKKCTFINFGGWWSRHRHVFISATSMLFYCIRRVFFTMLEKESYQK